MSNRVALALAMMTVCPACSGGTGPLDGLQSIRITPKDLVLEFALGTPAVQAYAAEGTFADSKRDITAQVQFKLEDARLGQFAGSSLTTSDSIAGRTKVTAQSGTISAETSLTTKVKLTVVGQGAPADSADLFAKAKDGGGAPALAYPPDGVLVPPNLSSMAVQWTDSANDLWELLLSSPTSELRIYTTQPQYLLASDQWNALAFSNRESEAQVRVRGMKRAAPAQYGQSPTVTMAFAAESVEGGIYYWAASGPNAGIMRFDFGKPEQKGESFYSNVTAPPVPPDGTRCVACHVLSPDGTRMAVTFGGGDGPAGILDVKSRKLTADRTYSANFQVYTPDSLRLIAASKGVLTLRDGVTGSALATLDTGGLASMPDLSPDGKQLVFVRRPSQDLDWSFTGGAIVTAPFDGSALGAKVELVPAQAGRNVYYPAFSPDGAWVIANGSSGDTYSDDDAVLGVVRATGGSPIVLTRTNAGGNTLRNSWPRWSPFVQTYKGKPLMWFTFSSTRDYGTTLINSTRDSKGRVPQIWMAAFAPEMAVAGQDPGYPAFWLPFQDVSTNNHIAQWTKKIIALE